MDLLKYFTLKFYIRQFKKALKVLLTRTIILISMFIISFLFTIIISILIKTPSIQDKTVSLYKKEDNLYTSLYNCNIYYSDGRHVSMHIGKQCVYLKDVSYSLIVEMEIMNINDIKSNYIESKIEFHSNRSEEIDFTINKITYINEEKNILWILYDILLYIPRKLGYYKGNIVKINYIDELDNRIFQLLRADLIIQDSLIEINNVNLIFIPNLSFIESIINKIYFFSIFAMFIISFLFQIAVYFLYNIFGYLFKICNQFFDDESERQVDEEEKESYDDINKIKTD